MTIELLDIGPVNVNPDNGVRYVLFPGEDIGHMTAEEQAAINAHWTPSLVAAWEGLVAVTPPTLSEAIAAKNDDVDKLREEKSCTDFLHGGRTFDASAHAKQEISYAIAYGQLNAIADVTTRTWTLADDTTVTLTWGELRAMATAMFEQLDNYHRIARAHKDNINALLAVEDVNAYDITVNW